MGRAVWEDSHLELGKRRKQRNTECVLCRDQDRMWELWDISDLCGIVERVVKSLAQFRSPHVDPVHAALSMSTWL